MGSQPFHAARHRYRKLQFDAEEQAYFVNIKIPKDGCYFVMSLWGKEGGAAVRQDELGFTQFHAGGFALVGVSELSSRLLLTSVSLA